jgi:hypothetical protein
LGGNVIGGSQDVIAASGVVDVGGWVGVETGTRRRVFGKIYI